MASSGPPVAAPPSPSVVTALRNRRLNGGRVVHSSVPASVARMPRGDLRPSAALRRTCGHVWGPMGSSIETRLNTRYDDMPRLVGQLLAAADRSVSLRAVAADVESFAAAVGDFQHPRFQARTDAALAMGGPLALVAFLRTLLHKFQTPRHPLLHHYYALASNALMSVRELTYSVHSLASGVFGAQTSVNTLFQFLKYPQCFNAALAALEEVLSFRQDTLQLALVDDVQDIMLGFNSFQLTMFCRVLALVVYEPETHDPATPLPASVLLTKAIQARRKLSVVERNHSLILRTPGLLSRLVDVLASSPPPQPGGGMPVPAASMPMGMMPMGMMMPPGAGPPMAMPLTPEQMAMLAGPGGPPDGTVMDHLMAVLAGMGGLDAPDMLQEVMGGMAPAVPPTSPPAVRQPRSMRAGSRARSPAKPSAATLASEDDEAAVQPVQLAAAATAFDSLGALEDDTRALLASVRSGSGGAHAASAGACGGGGAGAGAGVGAGAGAGAGGTASQSDIFDDVPPPRQARTVRVSMSDRATVRSATSPSEAAPSGAAAAGTQAVVDQMTSFAVSAHWVEVLFLLGGLMSGKRRVDIQDHLARIGAVRVIRRVVLVSDWAFQPTSPPQRIHGATCECQTGSAQQIQLLRLIHALVDRDTDDPADRWAPRSRLLTAEELVTIYRLDTDMGFTGGVDMHRAYRRAKATFRRRGVARMAKGKGLLAVLIHILMACSAKSPFRFWLSSSIETFLRGAPLGARRWVTRSGLLLYLTDAILSAQRRTSGDKGLGPAAADGGDAAGGDDVDLDDTDDDDEGDDHDDDDDLDTDYEPLNHHHHHHHHHHDHDHDHDHGHEHAHGGGAGGGDGAAAASDDTSSSSQEKYSMQTSFDLLGECTKLNPETLVLLESCVPVDTFRSVLRIACSRMVDSNVFLRALLLTLDHCKADPERHAAALDSEAARFLTKYRVPILFRLMGTVRMSDLTQENICCVNTAVLWFVIAERQGELEALLKDLGAYIYDCASFPELETVPIPDGEPDPLTDPANCIQNFLSLLTFWQTYYTTRGRDQRGLMSSSGFTFAHWRRVVHLLSNDSDGKLCALVADV